MERNWSTTIRLQQTRTDAFLAQKSPIFGSSHLFLHTLMLNFPAKTRTVRAKSGLVVNLTERNG